MSNDQMQPLSSEDLAAEAGTALPAKEVVSLLDLNVDLDLGIDLAAPVDLAVAANANVAAPIDAAVAANVLSVGSSAGALSHQDVAIDQGISGEAVANAPQDSTIDQSNDVIDGGTTAPAPAPAGTGVTVPDATTGALDGDLLNVDAKVALDADLAAPVAGAVAANANVAAPIDASVGANVASVGSEATAIADQSGSITQHLDDVTAEANADQTSNITQ
jgi:hypothetical protein